MARPVWTGTISFGLVNVAVQAFTAVRDHDVHFHQLHKTSGARIRNRKIDEKSGREVDAKDIVMGYELGNGKVVTFESDELDDLRPKSTRAVEVTDFVALADIDPIYYERTYWLAAVDDTARKAYQLLLAAMVERERAAIGTVVMRNKQYLTAIRPLDGVLAMSTMRFADEIVPRAELDLAKSTAKPDSKTMHMATQLIDALSSDWKPEQYHDTFAEELRTRIEAKGAGKEMPEEADEQPTADVLDLMTALQQSLDAGRKKTPATKAAAKKTAAKRATAAVQAPEKKAAAKAPAKKAVAKKPAARKSA